MSEVFWDKVFKVKEVVSLILLIAVILLFCIKSLP
jgi:hypothetical protein